MGNFFTSIQIHNSEQLSKEQFIELFCNKMKENGFVVGNADDHEISYALAFADNCKWVAVSSESYEQGNAAVQKDTGNIAKMLNTRCINVTVVDSDFAMLDLYSNSGKKLDAAVMGRYDDYLGDDISAPKKNIWSELISKNSTWERFTEVQQGDYVFVEDGLAELAPILDMDSRNILFDAEDANESDENICFLYFKKASAKKSKKLTLNAAFHQVFGEALVPLGFVKVKSRYPYYVRILNNEIIHVITYITKSSGFRGKKAFEIYGGASSIYRDEIDFSVNPTDNIAWMCSNFTLFRQFHPVPQLRTDAENSILDKLNCFYYETDSDESVLNEVKNSFELTKHYLLSYINTITDIDKMIAYIFHNTSIPCVFGEQFEGLLFLKTTKYYDLIKEKIIMYEKKYKQELDMQKYGYDFGCTYEKYERKVSARKEYISMEILPIEKILHTPDLHLKYNEMLEMRKNENLKKLKSYGISVVIQEDINND